jgi:hypothetical protein
MGVKVRSHTQKVCASLKKKKIESQAAHKSWSMQDFVGLV